MLIPNSLSLIKIVKTVKHVNRHLQGVQTQNHDSHQIMIEDFKKRFFISLMLSVPIILLSPEVQSLLGISLQFPGDTLILFIFSTGIYFYGGKPFLEGLTKEVLARRPGMMTLIGLAITVAYFYSTAVLLGLPGMLLFWELATLIDVMLLGHWVEMRSVGGASKALEKLAQLMPTRAHRILDDGSLIDVPLAQLKKQNLVLVRPGEKVPADGIVIDGSSEVNEAALTGESVPVFKSQGDSVIGGSLNQNGSLVVRVDKSQQEAYVAQVVNLVRHVMESKSHAQDLADKAAFVLTLVALSIAPLTLALWLGMGSSLAFSIERAVTVMVIACPHALGLAIPLVIAAITALAARQGLLIKNRLAFEAANKIDTVVFDKTGTLTEGKFQVTNVLSVGTLSPDKVLALGASTERFSKHAIAYAMRAKAEEQNIKVPTAVKGKTTPGKGTQVHLGTTVVFAGNQKLMQEIPFTADRAQETYKQALQQAQELMQQGKTVIFIATQDNIEGIIAATDVIRQQSYRACKTLKARGINVVMITGDNYSNAHVVADKLGIDTVLAEVLPDRKAAEIEELQKTGSQVAMVGDGINDVPALAQADVGIAIGAGTDVALETADVILVQSNPEKVVDVIDLAHITRRKTLQNLFWAIGYNIIALPIAAGVLYNYGIIVTPAVGALFMSLSVVIVSINSRFV